MDPVSLFGEMKRRRVFRALVGYGIAAFAVLQITGNFEALKHFREQVVRVWRKWLGRRSQRARMTWDRMRQLLERNPLPRARILRPYSPA